MTRLRAGQPSFRLFVSVGLAVTALIMSACGGSGGTPTATSAPTPTVDNRPVVARLKQHPKGETDAPAGYLEYLPAAYGDGAPRPLLVFLHGYGENGNGTLSDLGSVAEHGPFRLVMTNNWPVEREFVVLAPQHPWPATDPAYAPCDQLSEYGASCAMKVQHDLGHAARSAPCTTPTEVQQFLVWAIANYDVDPKRVYLTGLSCGAFSAYEYLAEYGASQVAAVVAIAGDARPARAAVGCQLAAVPIWAFHGDADNIVAPAGTVEPMAELAKCPAPPANPVKTTIYAGIQHDSWAQTYDLSAGNDIYAWMLGYSRP